MSVGYIKSLVMKVRWKYIIFSIIQRKELTDGNILPGGQLIRLTSFVCL